MPTSTEKIMAATFHSRQFRDFFFIFLGLLGTASFVIMDTDYSNYALICTCQGKKFFFDILTFHRRSCTILQRSPERDSAISRKVNFYIILTYFGIKTLVLQQFSSLKKQV